MEDLVLRIVEVLTGSPLLWSLSLSVPVAITIAGLTGWRLQVPNALPLGIWGALLCLWMFPPLQFPYDELNQIRRMVSFLGWFWLVKAWSNFLSRDWPAPIWAHWIVGTLLLALGVSGAVILIRAF